jgi:adenylyl-sulfate kinase
MNDINNLKPCVIWLTGLSGSGKSTLAEALALYIGKSKPVYVLDGDVLRKGLNKDLGYADNARVENIRRTAEVARILVDAGIIVIVALISPFRDDREMARKLCNQSRFFEIHVSTSLEVCENRDVKGLYKLARLGHIQNFTGLTSVYEAPLSPDFVIDTASGKLAVHVAELIGFIHSKF